MGRWRKMLVAVALAALSACGGNPEETNGQAGDASGDLAERLAVNATVEAFSEPAADAPTATSARDTAQALVDSKGLDEEAGFTVGEAIHCEGARLADSASYICSAVMNDGGRAGRPAFVTFRLYEGPTDFAERKADLIRQVEALPGRWRIDVSPNITLTTAKGEKRMLRNVCSQSRGVENSPAYCIVEAHDTVLVETVAAPLAASSETFTYGENDRSAAVDVDHSSDLSLLAAALVGGIR